VELETKKKFKHLKVQSSILPGHWPLFKVIAPKLARASLATCATFGAPPGYLMWKQRWRKPAVAGHVHSPYL